MKNIPQQLRALSVLNAIDLHFAQFVCRQVTPPCEKLYLAACMVSHFNHLQHTAFDLKAHGGKSLKELIDFEDDCSISLPTYTEWKKVLKQYPAVVSDSSESGACLIHDEQSGLLYLNRFFKYEEFVASEIKRRCKSQSVDTESVTLGMKKLFPKSEHLIDWQETAAFAALRSNFCVITGGPGTGKTTTVAKVLALLLQQNRTLKIDLVAPTGKAQDRMVKSIKEAKQSLNFDTDIVELIPEEASTLHRYLGAMPNSNNFRYNQKNHRSTDLLLVDEASMVSLPMFASLFAALRPECRVILLGDKDQLAPVDSGNLLGDICEANYVNNFTSQFKTQFNKVSSASTHPENLPLTTDNDPLVDSIVKLEFSYRFGAESGIGCLSSAINRGCKQNSATIVEELANGKVDGVAFTDIAFSPLDDTFSKELAALVGKRQGILRGYKEYWEKLKNVSSPAEVLKEFDKFQILCAVHNGMYGVNQVNEAVEKVLYGKSGELFYHGRPIMVNSNDYNLKLFNGDVGIILTTKDGFRAFFPDVESETRSFPIAVLPEHSTAFAKTVHQSQGSEFDHVLMILPDKNSRILTKEIIYTGITRAKEKVAIWSPKDVLREAIGRKTTRTSGLKKRLTEV